MHDANFYPEAPEALGKLLQRWCSVEPLPVLSGADHHSQVLLRLRLPPFSLLVPAGRLTPVCTDLGGFTLPFRLRGFWAVGTFIGGACTHERLYFNWCWLMIWQIGKMASELMALHEIWGGRTVGSLIESSWQQKEAYVIFSKRGPCLGGNPLSWGKRMFLIIELSVENPWA